MKTLQIILGILLMTTIVVQAQQQPDYYKKRENTYRIYQEGAKGSPYERYNSFQITARYGIAMPLGGLKDYADKASKFHYSVSGEIVRPTLFSYGLTVGYSYFKNRLPRAVYHFDEQDISAVQTRTLSALSFQLFGKYHFAGIDAPIRPYILAGAGGSSIKYLTYYGSLEDSYNKFKISAQAGAGVRFLFSKNGGLGADLQASYFYSPFDADYIKDISHLSASVGVFYRWW